MQDYMLSTEVVNAAFLDYLEFVRVREIRMVKDRALEELRMED